MKLYVASRICHNDYLFPGGVEVFFTNLTIGKSFDPYKAKTSPRSSRVFDSSEAEEEEIFSTGLKYKNIVLICHGEESDRIISEPFTPTPKEISECQKYLESDGKYYFGNLKSEVPFVRRRKPRNLIEEIANSIDKYIIKKKLRLCDPDESDFGQCISSFYLADAVSEDKEMENKAAKLTGRHLTDLCSLFYERTIWIDEEADISYGDVFILDAEKIKNKGIKLSIWDGYP